MRAHGDASQLNASNNKHYSSALRSISERAPASPLNSVCVVKRGVRRAVRNVRWPRRVLAPTRRSAMPAIQVSGHAVDFGWAVFMLVWWLSAARPTQFPRRGRAAEHSRVELWRVHTMVGAVSASASVSVRASYGVYYH